MFNDENVVLCASSAYDKKFYLNEDFSKLPDEIKDELKIMCVLFTSFLVFQSFFHPQIYAFLISCF